MDESDKLRDAARAIYDACFTLAPISFEEAAERETLHYHRALQAAARVRDAWSYEAQIG